MLEFLKIPLQISNFLEKYKFCSFDQFSYFCFKLWAS